jgi:hypothetical protein
MPDLSVTKSAIDFGAGLADAQDALSGAAQQVVNILKDASGFIRLAPGTSAWSWFPSTIPNGSEVIGITEFNGRVIFVTEDRKIWLVQAPGLVSALSDSTAATQLDGTLPPTFAATRTRLFIAGGGVIQYWEPSLALSARVTAGPNASHVVGNSQRLIALLPDNSGIFQWTEPGEGVHLSASPDGWDAFNYAEAEARPDVALALHENSDEIFVFGARTVQIFTPDVNTGYAAAYTLNRGLGPRYSVINLLERRLFAWMTEERDIVMSSVRDDPEVISHPFITKTLKEMSYVDDCRGEYLKIGNFRLLVFRFPTAGECLVYDLDAKRWCRFRGYDSTIGAYAAWPVTALFYWPQENVWLAGLSTGEIATLDMDALTVAGQQLIGEVILGYDNGGTEGSKQTLILRAPLRRGLGAMGTTTPPFVEVYYRDKPGAWSRPVTFSLGAAEQDRPSLEKRLVTRPFVRRQWRLVTGAGVSISIGPMEQTLEILEE